MRSSHSLKEDGADIAVDSAGTAYVVGRTSSPDFPLPGGMPAKPGSWGGFVVRVGASGSELLSGVYLRELSQSSAVALDAAGAVYVAGSILDRTSADVHRRQVVWKLSPTLDRVVYLSAGVPHAAWVSGISVDASGRAHVSGTAEKGVPALNPLPGVSSGRSWQAFLIILSPAGEPLLSSPVTSGDGFGVAVDSSGSVYVAGSSIFPFGKTLGRSRAEGMFPRSFEIPG